VTTGEAWQFLKLEGAAICMNRTRHYLNELPTVLCIFQHIIDSYAIAGPIMPTEKAVES
jgi:hypothetical protein